MTEGLVHTVQFDPNPTQKAFIMSKAKADLFSSRVGEGKSAGLAWSIYYHTVHNPGAAWCLIRDTWENLQRTTLKEFFKWFPNGVFGNWHEGKKTWTWAEGVGKGTVVCMGMDDPSDASKLQSLELAGIAMDEPAPAALSAGINELVFDVGFSRLRQAEMNWYAVKLAENNPDETHWTYRRFVDPGTPEFVSWQPPHPENVKNLPDDYYGSLRRVWAHRPDLVDRFVEGKYGFQQDGASVTPEWNDSVHLANGLMPIRGGELTLLWDFGLNPTCIITQVTPLRDWLILEAYVGEEEGVEELISGVIKPVLRERYRGYTWKHIGDPAGRQREQSSSQRSAVRVLRKELGGIFRAGPVRFEERREPLRAILSRQAHGKGKVRVDRVRAREVWQALRGGWHFRVSNSGVTSHEPVKDKHSHPGDAMGYGAAILFPLGKLLVSPTGLLVPRSATFFGDDPRLVKGQPGAKLPMEGRIIGGPGHGLQWES